MIFNLNSTLFKFFVFLFPLFSFCQNGNLNITQNCNPDTFNLSGGGSYCSGSPDSLGLSVILDSSQTWVSYQLLKDSTPFGAFLLGTGDSLVWDSLPAGTYTVIAANDTNQTCTALMNGSIDIIEYALPIVDAGVDQSSCLYCYTPLNATVSPGSGSYSYQWEPASFLQNPTLQDPIVYPMCSMQFVLTVYDSVSTCTQSDSMFVFSCGCAINATVVAQPNNICLGDTVFLSALTLGCGTGPFTYSWSSVPPGFISNVKDTFDIPNSNTTYRVEVNDTFSYGCMAGIDNQDVIMSSPNVYTLSGGGTYCAGTGGLTVTLSGSETGVHYQLFKNGNPHGLHLTGSGNPLFWSNLYPGVYNVIATKTASPNCPINMSDSIEIVDNPVPLIDVGPDQLCYYAGTVQLDATVTGGSGSFAYQWQPASLLVNPNALTTSTIPMQSCTQFVLHVTDLVSLCVYTDTVNVITSCFPLTVQAVAQPNVFCIGDTIQLNALTNTFGGYYYTYSWFSIPPGFTSSSYNPIVSPQENTIYIVEVNDGMQTLTSSVSVTVTSMLNHYNLGGLGFYCDGDSGTFVSITDSDLGIVYQLFKNDTAFGLPQWGTGSHIVWDSLYSGIYNVLAFDSSLQRCNFYYTNDIGIISIQPPVVDLGADINSCFEDSLALIGPSGPNLYYIWIKLPSDTLSYNQILYVDSALNGLNPVDYVLNVSSSCGIISDTVNVQFTTCTGIDKYNHRSIKVYPNPANKLLFIETQNCKVFKTEMYDILGDLIYSSGKTSVIDISSWTTGMYFLKIFSEDSIDIVKVLIE